MSEKVNTSLKIVLFHFLSLLLFMALLSFLPTTTTTDPSQNKQSISNRKRIIKEKKQKQKQPSSWDQIKNLLTCKQIEASKIHDPSKPVPSSNSEIRQHNSKLGTNGPCSSICSFRDVVHGNTRVVHRPDNSPEGSTDVVDQETRLLTRKPGSRSASNRSVRSTAAGTGSHTSSSSRTMQFRKLSGCYECHTIVDPSRYPVARTTICACSQCGEVFPKIESLELHQAVKHAVSELGPDDSGRNIVEIIFKSSWLKKDSPICKIDRILKVHNSQRTIQRFEGFRDMVKVEAKKNPRCGADGNELLRFHCTTLTCSLGSRGTTNLCSSIPGCNVCTIIRQGFNGKTQLSIESKGVCTTASSGRAHDCLGPTDGRRAMLVCRVIAGRVRRMDEADAEVEATTGCYDSVVGYAGVYSSMEELYVSNPKAILPCFVVIYKALES
ncbi:uncharacterized protein LOC124931165 [Impatiens glandulifera]|uniref:uncharacterized protein LOC124931165 n=1 Tax=Impatiens glandulifera TaxID=253017 RepID=UPI001FB0546D|nr:uncharacterized protein LOC124931165 [Impatiens glandulifera]